MVLTPPLWSVLGTRTAIGVPRVTPAKSPEAWKHNTLFFNSCCSAFYVPFEPMSCMSTDEKRSVFLHVPRAMP